MAPRGIPDEQSSHASPRLNQLKQFHRDRPHELQPVELTATAAKAASKTIRFIAVFSENGALVRRGEFAPEGKEIYFVVPVVQTKRLTLDNIFSRAVAHVPHDVLEFSA